ncbi:carbohydrate ABC transporter permease [Candidatus Sodalis pierantonius]|uniref:carbohydrate ABC transporter permease n=1 Tax=Candidatus Sodalis pierantonii TaxID=1486991 RepID=UPI00056EC969|nr:sugar ABC transporter permease [Candidatus Sodalis pierantonius]
MGCDRNQQHCLPWLILSPSLVFLLLFTYFPLVRSVYDSLFDSRMAVNDPPFVGMDNFIRLLQDSVFWRALGNNIVYILLTVVPGVVLALLLAVALWENHRVNRWLRTAFFFPMIVPMVSATALWLFIFMPGLGPLDHALSMFFGPLNTNYLGRSNSALLALSLIGVWKFAGYYMLFFLAGLQGIPASTREAAIMEGASPTQVFFGVTLPLLRPTLSFVVTTELIYAITQIDHVAVMTRGGPDNATTVLLYYIQNLAWDTHDLGKASAATFITLLGLFAFSLFNLNLLEKGAHYER